MRRKCRSLRMIKWSRHSRFTLPIRRSTYGFCHGLRGAVTTSSTPIAITVERNDCPYAPSRSRIRYRGAVSHRKGFANLLRYPIRGRMCRDAEMDDLAALVVEHDEPEQEAERGRGDHETVDRRQAIGVISKECPPRLRGRRGVTDHVFRDGGLGDGKAKLQKLPMNPRRTPQRVLPRHPSDQIADLPRHGRSARFSAPRLPCPEKSEPPAVPTDDGLGPDDYQGVAPARP